MNLAVGPTGSRNVPKKKVKPRFLGEMLMDMPASYSLNRNDRDSKTKHEEMLDVMSEYQKEQRRRLLEKHTIQHAEWNSDTIKQVDWDRTFHFHHPQQRPHVIMLSSSYNTIKSPGAVECLRRMPASERHTLVCAEQFKLPSNLSDKDEYKVKELSSTEFAAEIAKQGAMIRKDMLREEQDMRLFQLMSKGLFYEVLLRNDPEKYGRNGTNSKKYTGSIASTTAKTEPSHVGVQRTNTIPETTKTSIRSVQLTDSRRPPPLSVPVKANVVPSFNPVQAVDPRIPAGPATSRDPRLSNIGAIPPTGPRIREGSGMNTFASRREEPRRSESDYRRSEMSQFQTVFGRREEPRRDDREEYRRDDREEHRRDDRESYHPNRRDREERRGGYSGHSYRRSRSPPTDSGNRRHSASSVGGRGGPREDYGRSLRDFEMGNTGERRRSMAYDRR
ncbi:hypothetical protein RUND412_008792 [Rhizina undulata]